MLNVYKGASIISGIKKLEKEELEEYIKLTKCIGIMDLLRNNLHN